jgi:hypothetical protein
MIPFVSVIMLSNKLGLPLAWLRAEAKAGRIPYLRTGRRLFFDVDAVRLELLERDGKRKGDRGKEKP